MVCFKGSVWYASILLIVVLGFGLIGCSAKGGLSSMSPIFPVEEPPADAENIVFDREATPPAVEVTSNGITITAQYYRQYDLDRKFNRGSQTSPFFYRAAWHQGEKTDVFYVKIVNNRSKPIIFNTKKTKLHDDTGGDYVALTRAENEERLLYKAGRDIKINNGLKKAVEILLETQTNDGVIDPGKSIEGYLPFLQITSRAVKVDLMFDIEKAPDTAIGRYQTETFSLPFQHDLAVRDAQPATVSF